MLGRTPVNARGTPAGLGLREETPWGRATRKNTLGGRDSWDEVVAAPRERGEGGKPRGPGHPGERSPDDRAVCDGEGRAGKEFPVLQGHPAWDVRGDQ